jgi:hypothetical protein
MSSMAISPLGPFNAAVSLASETVSASAKAYGETLARVLDGYGLKNQAQYARTTLPFYMSVSANEAMSWGMYMMLAGGNPFIATTLKGMELSGRAWALGMFPNPLPFG